MRCERIAPHILIDHDLCIRCLKCVRSCPAEILIAEKREKIKVLNPDSCFECRACEVCCPESAIRVMCVVAALSAP
ncbi:MAG: 4Fe-4S binding protein [Candidatus Heimdallarchaeota archaeon]|nr:MAG: 4Fe-4S binding protein [Candidatus Heimdallarchaeota archaeon]